MTAMSETKKAALSGKYAAYPEYKDSGVEWLGDIPTHWSAKPIKFLCTYNDEVINDSTDNNYEIEYVDIGSVSASTGITKTETICFSKAPSRARRIVKDGDVIISTVRTYLEAIAPINNPPSNMVVSTGFAVIRPTSELHKDFAAYCLRAKGFIKEVVARSVGVSYPAINASDLVNISIPFVSIDEQAQIAAFLDHETAKIDTLIEKQQQLIELLKEKRQAVISHAVTKGLNPDAPMKDSGVEWLGEVPEHWSVSKLKFECEIVDCRNKTPEYFDNGDYFVVRTTNVKNQKLNFNGALYTDKKNFDIWTQRGIPPEGSILFTREAPTGEVCLVPKDLTFCMGQRMMNFIANDNSYTDYLFDYLISDCLDRYINSVSHGSTVSHLRVEQVENIPVLVPSLDEIKQIHLKINSLKSKFDAIEKEAIQAIALMQERRTALISAAVTGKIDVRHWVAPTTSSDATEVQQEVSV